MKKYYPLIAAGVALTLVGGGSYYFIIYKPGEDITTPEKAINVIVNALKIKTPDSLSKLGTDFLIAWAKALRGGRDKFILNGKSYSSTTGTSI